MDRYSLRVRSRCVGDSRKYSWGFTTCEKPHCNSTTVGEIEINRAAHNKINCGLAAIALAAFTFPLAVMADDARDPIADALSAAWPGMADDVTVVDRNGKTLKERSNGYTCMPTPPMLTGTAPMFMDHEWMKWADAWQDKKAYAPETLGISYMLAGDEGTSDIDPHAEGPTDDNEWVVEGPHLMILAPEAMLKDYPTDPKNGGAYVMWKGTPYAHLMVPVGTRE